MSTGCNPVALLRRRSLTPLSVERRRCTFDHSSGGLRAVAVLRSRRAVQNTALTPGGISVRSRLAMRAASVDSARAESWSRSRPDTSLNTTACLARRGRKKRFLAWTTHCPPAGKRVPFETLIPAHVWARYSGTRCACTRPERSREESPDRGRKLPLRWQVFPLAGEQYRLGDGRRGVTRHGSLRSGFNLNPAVQTAPWASQPDVQKARSVSKANTVRCGAVATTNEYGPPQAA